MRHIYTSIDIGSDTIKVVTSELYKGKLNLLAASSTKSQGIKKGLITDVNAASNSLKAAIAEVEDMLGIKIKKVITSIPAYFAEYVKIDGEIEITNEEHEVTGDDVVRVLQQAMRTKISATKEMVTAIPIDFCVDSKSGIKDPKGLIGNKLKARAILISTPKKNIYSVVNLIESIGIEVVDISLNSIGDINALKQKGMDDKIGAIINIGDETTTISIYNKCVLIKSSIIGMSGKDVDSDIAYKYKIDLIAAKKVKEKFALAHTKYASNSETYILPNEVKIDQLGVSDAAMSRLQEILSLTKKELLELTNREMEYIIITGGMSNMSHFDLVAQSVFGENVIVGNVRLIGIRNNKYSSAVGNIVYFINKLKVKGRDYTMVSETDVEVLASTKKSIINVSNESMLDKVFGYFFGE
ncbi:MAG: cell division protein FtsA [Clostridium sp.]|nr:cell division protein FtsA [Clostridium sp.]MCM1444320.1 cell division protein FtsA [Candidatus Amulumruptor caecigallinarius]